MITEAAIRHITSVTPAEVANYSRYLETIRPHSVEDEFKRWLFTYASVHTSWKMNCKLYKILRETDWIHDPAILMKKLVDSRAGLHNRRVKFLSQFAKYYHEHPLWFRKAGHESWKDYRDRVWDAVPGIGQTKASFWIELCYPLEAEVICTDTHVLQLYGYPASYIQNRHVKNSEMADIEKHWVETCKANNVPPVISRWIFWDRKQGYMDSRYWSYVLEEDYHARLQQAARIAG